MQKLYSYVIVKDTGAAPNPFWGICTLTICKPQIRKTASVGDWILGFGSTNVKEQKGYKDYSGRLVYAMQVTEKFTLEEYDAYCQDKRIGKIASFRDKDWRRKVGDCIYGFEKGVTTQRQGVHNSSHVQRDLSGKHALLSDYFYYFGRKAIPLPAEFQTLVHRGRGHKITGDTEMIEQFELWLKAFKNKKLYGDPQQKYLFERISLKSPNCP